MPNEVKIAVTSQDRSAAGMDSARNRAEALASSTKRIGEVAGGILTANLFARMGEAAVRGFTDTIRAASGLEQAIGGTEAVFGDASGAIDRFGKNSADTAGLSEREFREMSTLVGGQLKRMTGDIGFASDGAIQLTRAGADLAATYGGTTRQAMDAFSAALRGEADPAERFNLNLKASVVNAKAVEMGLAETTSAVSEQAKAQAILALVTEQSADAQGQFAREGDTAAVAQQKMTAALEDAQARIGSALLPVLAQAASMVATLAEFMADLPAPVYLAVAAISALAAGMLVLLPRIHAAKLALDALNISARTAAVAAGPIGAALAIAGAAVMTFGAKEREASQRVEELTGSLDTQTGALTENSRAVAAKQLQDAGALEDAQRLGIDLDLVTSAYLGEKDAIAEVNRQLEGHRNEVGLAEAVTFGLSTALDAEDRAARNVARTIDEGNEVTSRARAEAEQLAGATETSAGAAETAAAAQEELASATESAEQQYNDARQALEDYNAAQRAATDPVFAMVSALENVDEAQSEYNDAVADYGPTSSQAQSSALKLAGAVADAEQAASDGDLSFDAFSRKLNSWVRSGVLTAAQADVIRARVDGARAAAENYAGDYVAHARAVVDTASVARAKAIMDSIMVPGVKYITARVLYPGVGYVNRGQLATGGMVGAESQAQAGGPRGGSRVLVGEQGPEIAELPFGTRVIPSGQSQAQLAGGDAGGPRQLVVNLSAGVIGSQYQLEEWLAGAIDNLHRRGRLPAGVSP